MYEDNNSLVKSDPDDNKSKYNNGFNEDGVILGMASADIIDCSLLWSRIFVMVGIRGG